jgi:hypothetical protein
VHHILSIGHLILRKQTWTECYAWLDYADAALQTELRVLASTSGTWLACNRAKTWQAG